MDKTMNAFALQKFRSAYVCNEGHCTFRHVWKSFKMNALDIFKTYTHIKFRLLLPRRVFPFQCSLFWLQCFSTIFKLEIQSFVMFERKDFVRGRHILSKKDDGSTRNWRQVTWRMRLRHTRTCGLFTPDVFLITDQHCSKIFINVSDGENSSKESED